jgi:hypothetical protein
MRVCTLLIALVAVGLAGSAQAARKVYDSSTENGVPGDFFNIAVNLCPPVQFSPGIIQGHVRLLDDGLGTVTMDTLDIQLQTPIDLGPDQLVITFGPGAFIFIESATTSISTAVGAGYNDLPDGVGHPSNTSGVGAHGPSGTAPGETTEWGLVTGWVQTGFQFCLSSPVTICNGAGFGHGQSVFPVLPSNTYDLGTWNFDSVGNYSGDTPYVQRTSNGGLQNSKYDLRGAFVGASLPALPLVGFGALALSLAVIGGRAALGKK